MIKKVFKKQCQLNVSVDTVKFNEDIFIYKYVVDFNNIEFYGLCHKEDFQNLTEKFLIPTRLANYNIYYLDVIQFENYKEREAHSLNEDIYKNYKIDFSVFFSEDKSLIPPFNECIILKEQSIEIPNSVCGNNLTFLFKYGKTIPLAQVVGISLIDGMCEYNPLISDLDYDLEKTIDYLEKREDIKVVEQNIWEDDVIIEKTKISSIEKIIKTQARLIYTIPKNNTSSVVYKDMKKDKYIEFYWFPTAEDWQKYYDQLVNYGFDVANKYLVDEILKIQRK